MKANAAHRKAIRCIHFSYSKALFILIFAFNILSYLPIYEINNFDTIYYNQEYDSEAIVHMCIYYILNDCYVFN